MQYTNPTANRLLLAVSLALAFVLPAAAQSTGVITGQVFNPSTQEYVRNAEVRVQGTNIGATTTVGGAYRLENVPAGSQTVAVTFTGFNSVTAEVTVPAGGTVAQNFDLVAAAAAKDETVVLETYKVTSQLDGNAKALQSQRNSMTLGRAVSADAFGDVTEGNVGEFLKYLPGVELEYVEADTRGPRLGGMGSEYASVTMDGMKLASADSFTQYVAFENSPIGTANRGFSFEAVSINSIESIEINRITSAEMEANAPAGNINMKTKRAFDRKGRRIGWTLSTVMNTEEFTLKKSAGPNDSTGYKFKPNYNFNYADTFFNNRLGLYFVISESNLYNEQYRIDHTWNRTPTATDLRPQVLTNLLLKDGPKWTERGLMSLAADFRATDDLTISLTAMFDSYDARFYNRQVNMLPLGTRATVAGDGVLTFGTPTPAAGAVQFGGGNGFKFTNTIAFTPKFEYRWKNFLIDGSFSYSHSRNDYDNLAKRTAGSSPSANITNVGFTATRSGPDEADWQITQTAGADWASVANLTNPRISDDNRFAKEDTWIQGLNVRYNPSFRWPTYLKAGFLNREFYYLVRNPNPFSQWSYIGPGGNTFTGAVNANGLPVVTTTGTFANYPSPFRLFGPNQVGVKFTSIGGGGAPAFPDRDTLGELFNDHPEYFTRDPALTAVNYEQATYTNSRDMKESITAGYVMANTKVKKLQLQGGIRYELTQVDSEEWDTRPNSEIIAAGYTITAGNPTTYAGMDYKYNSRPRVRRHGEYHDYFPSLTAKYSIRPNILADIGWGRTIKRPNIGLLSGVTQYNEDLLEVRLGNPALNPERADKVVGALSYFFGNNSSNNISVVGSHTKITDLVLETRFSAEDFGITDPELAAYEFISSLNAGAPVTFRSLEVSYLQYLTFLPSFLRGTSINASYTRTYADRRILGLVPHNIKGGVSYRYKRFNVGLNAVWRDNSPWNNNVRYLKANVKFDLNGAFKITNRVAFTFSGRNIFQEPHRIFETSAGNPDVLWRYENYGTNWTFGVSGTF